MAKAAKASMVKPKLAALQQLLGSQFSRPSPSAPASPSAPPLPTPQQPVTIQPVTAPKPADLMARKAARKAAKPPTVVDPKKAANRAARRARKGKPPLAY